MKLQISAEKIKIPVIFYNLKGYDSHFIIQQLGELLSDSHSAQGTRQEGSDSPGQRQKPISINAIPCNAEKYMASYINNKLSFIDSFQFMSSSLEKLADNLSEEGFIYTKEYFTDEKQFQFMKEKRCLPL